MTPDLGDRAGRSTSAAAPGVCRQVEQVMGMPVSLALRGRHRDTASGRRAWAEVVTQLREVDRIFSTYRDDSTVNRLDRGDIDIAQCPPEVAEVLALGQQAEEQSGGAFSIYLPSIGPSTTGPNSAGPNSGGPNTAGPNTGGARRRLDPSGVVKGWAVERAARLLAELDDTDFCLSAGGDMVCHTADLERPDWRIGIENPR